MTRVLAAVDRSAATRPVLSAAAALAGLLGASVDAVHVREAPDSELAVAAGTLKVRVLEGVVVDTLLDAAKARDVAALIVGSRGTPAGKPPSGRSAFELAGAIRKPLIIVPPDCRCPVTLRRVLAASDSATARFSVLLRTIERLVGDRLEVTVLQVHDDASIPAFEDQPHHAREAREREFRRRTGARHGEVKMELRTGQAAEAILATSREMGADLIAVIWDQNLSAGRSLVVRALLERSTIPVLLVPSPAGRVPR